MEMKKEVNEKVELIEKVEQPNFSVENIRETRPAYHRSGDLVWKNKPKRPKQYVQYPIEKIHYSNEFIVREDILEQSRQMDMSKFWWQKKTTWILFHILKQSHLKRN